MPRLCPVCPSNHPLRAISAGEIEIDNCAQCGGMWFDAGELELFPNRPSAETFLAQARHAPSRCAKNHPVSRGNAACGTCGGAPITCPACSARLALVHTSVCAVDVCVQCEGIWLDAGEFERLEGFTDSAPKAGPASAAPSAGHSKDAWQLPAPAEAGDPWSAPGHAGPIVIDSAAYAASSTPFACTQCRAPLDVTSAFAFNGELYCASCRPEGAVSGRELPKSASFEGLRRVLDLLTRKHGRRFWDL